MEGKTALIALNDEKSAQTYMATARMFGYIPVFISADNIPSGLSRAVFAAGRRERLLKEARTNSYSACLMDVNFGMPSSNNVQIGYDVWQLFKSRVETGEARFLAFAGFDETVRAAIQRGIPAEFVTNKNKLDLVGFFGG
jgi:hypothetical protein